MQKTEKKGRVADFVAHSLANHGIEHVFMVTGGGAMHLNDALGGHPNLKYVACHHEQACAMAADAYFRMSGKLAAVNVTTGPGGTNAITGVFGAWTDSIGMVVVSGQVKWETLIRSSNMPMRQLGDQEVDIIKMVEGVTKYAVLVTDPQTIRYHVEKAIFLARTGRPGPVWLDIPIAVQSTPIEFDSLKGFDPLEEGFASEKLGGVALMAPAIDADSTAVRGTGNNMISATPGMLAPTDGTHGSGIHANVFYGAAPNSKSIGIVETPKSPNAVQEIEKKTLTTLKLTIQNAMEKIQKAKRPVIMVGGGIRAANSHEMFMKFAERLHVPVATCWNAHDVIWNDHPLYAGRPGSVGTRAGNFTVQNSDCVIVLGSRLNIRQISYNWEAFARNAHKIMVDIDQTELDKHTLKIDQKIHCDLKTFFGIAADCKFEKNPEHQQWIDWCKVRVKKYPVCLPQHWELKEKVNPYCFVDELYRHLNENEWVVTGDGTACVVTFQGADLKKGQRLFTNSGCASMGFDLPAAIGAHFAGEVLREKKDRVICIAGDGSIQMNLQELQTLVSHKIPAKIFVLNNEGYHSIRQTQHNFFNGHVVGCGEESGLNFPKMEKIAAAYGIPFSRATSYTNLKESILSTLSSSGIHICEVVLDLKQAFEPKLSSKRLPDGKMVTAPLEDMFPFLSREELAENMIGG